MHHTTVQQHKSVASASAFCSGWAIGIRLLDLSRRLSVLLILSGQQSVEVVPLQVGWSNRYQVAGPPVGGRPSTDAYQYYLLGQQPVEVVPVQVHCMSCHLGGKVSNSTHQN